MNKIILPVVTSLIFAAAMWLQYKSKLGYTLVAQVPVAFTAPRDNVFFRTAIPDLKQLVSDAKIRLTEMDDKTFDNLTSDLPNFGALDQTKVKDFLIDNCTDSSTISPTRLYKQIIRDGRVSEAKCNIAFQWVLHEDRGLIELTLSSRQQPDGKFEYVMQMLSATLKSLIRARLSELELTLPEDLKKYEQDQSRSAELALVKLMRFRQRVVESNSDGQLKAAVLDHSIANVMTPYLDRLAFVSNLDENESGARINLQKLLTFGIENAEETVNVSLQKNGNALRSLASGAIVGAVLGILASIAISYFRPSNLQIRSNNYSQ